VESSRGKVIPWNLQGETEKAVSNKFPQDQLTDDVINLTPMTCCKYLGASVVMEMK
jgi:hypothetical protein